MPSKSLYGALASVPDLPPGLEGAKEKKRLDAQVLRNQIAFGAFFYDERWFDADFAAGQSIIGEGVNVIGLLDQDYPFRWIDQENRRYRIRDRGAAVLFVDAFRAHRTQAFDTYMNILDALDDATTEEEVNAIDILGAPWPVNQVLTSG